MYNHYQRMLKVADSKIDELLRLQDMDVASPNYGGMLINSFNYIEPAAAMGYFNSLATLYFNEDSVYFRNKLLSERMSLIIDYLERMQRDNGTFDLLISNFYSGPDTAFAIHQLVRAYRIMIKYGLDNYTIALEKRVYDLIKSSGYGMMNGGFHTPNHRWVVAAALMLAYNTVKVEDFKRMALRYLQEGIDCDENGEFTEKSAGMYNAVNDNALIILSEELNMPELLSHVKRNLDMMFTYIEPDGSIFTMNSVRKDKGENDRASKFYPEVYYHIYLAMAAKFNDGRYMTVLERIMDDINIYRAGTIPYSYLWIYMLNPEYRELDIKSEPLPDNYVKYFKNSGIVKGRRGELSFTILKGKPNFLFFQVGKVRMYMKICASFFAVAQFNADSIEKKNDSYVLNFTANASYKMPFTQAPATSDWWEMDHSKREIVSKLSLNMAVAIKEETDGLTVNIATSGCDRVPIKLEFVFSAGTVIKGKSFMLSGEAGQSINVTEGYVEVKKDADIITIGPAFAEHMYTANMRGSEPQSSGEFTVYFSGYTNIDHTVNIRRGKHDIKDL